MKYIPRAVALVAFSAVLAACATTEMEAKKDVPPPAAAPAAAPMVVAIPDAALTKDVQVALAKEAQLKGAKIAASATTDGAVILSGTVKNEWQQYLAGDIATKTKGVKSVKNSIKVPD